MQQIFFKENVAIALANTTFKEILHRGDTLNKPYRSHPVVKDYTKGTDITVSDRFATNEQLSVATAKVVPYYVDDIDQLENKWDTAARFAQDGQKLLNNVLDQVVLSEASNSAVNYIDQGDVGGSSGSNISASVSNIDQIFTAAARELNERNIPMSGRFFVIGGRMLELIQRYIGGRETAMGDIVGQNGKIMNRFGFELYYSNNLYFTATWTPADNPTAADYIEINGARLEFVAAVDSDEASTANIGVDIGGNTATTLDNLVACINQSGTEGTTYGTHDANNDPARWKLINCGAVGTDGTTYLGLVAYGDIIVSASDSNDPWSSQTSYPLFGMKGATDLVIQKKPNVAFRVAEKRLGRYIYPWMLYGYLTFADMEEALGYAKIDASGWS